MSLILLISQVSSDGMVCSIAMLFTMLCLVFTSILVAGWKMTKCNSHHFLTHIYWIFQAKGPNKYHNFGTTLRHLWNNFGTTLKQIWDNFGTTLRQLRDIFEATLVQLSDNFATSLRHIWYNFETSLVQPWNNFGTALRQPWDIFGTTLDNFQTVLRQLLKTWKKPWDNIETFWKKLLDYFEITFGLYEQNMHSSLKIELCIHLGGLLFQSHLHNSSHIDNNVFLTEP